MCFLITDGQSTEFIYLNFTLSFIGKKCQRHSYPFKKKEKRLFQIKKKSKEYSAITYLFIIQSRTYSIINHIS